MFISIFLIYNLILKLVAKQWFSNVNAFSLFLIPFSILMVLCLCSNNNSIYIDACIKPLSSVIVMMFHDDDNNNEYAWLGDKGCY